MGWGFYGYGGGFGSTKKKKVTKSYDNWFERLTAVELKSLLQAAQLPVSGTKKKQIERLLGCPLTEMYATEKPHRLAIQFHDCGGALSVSDLQDKCRDAKLKKSGNKFELIIRLVEHTQASKKRTATDGNLDVDEGPAKKKGKTSAAATTKKRTPLEGEALEKRVTHRLQKLNKQIDEKLTWKSSYKYMNGAIKGARVAIECPEPEVFLALFEQDENLKKSPTGDKLSLSFKTDDAMYKTKLSGGKSYQYGAQASIMAPASISLNNGKISFSFKYTVKC